MRDLKYKHFFRVENGKFIWENSKMFQFIRNNLEGKRGYAIIEEEKDSASPKQLGYYFGGIIRKECLNSDCFSGWGEKEVHNYLLLKTRGTHRTIYFPDGHSELHELPADFEAIMNNKEDMIKYIEEVIAFLITEHQIYPKPASYYKYNKFTLDVKTFKSEPS